MGPELIVRMAGSIAASAQPVVYFCTGNEDHLGQFVQGLGPGAAWHIQSEPREQVEAQILIVPVGDGLHREETKAGSPSAESGRLALLALDLAIARARRGTAGLLTAPLSKEWVARAGARDFAGHTGYLAEAFQRRVIMLMHGDDISVIPLTIHIPINAVSAALKTELLERDPIRLLLAVAGLPVFRGQPWALLGLNPHAGEGGLLGTEEVDWLSHVAAGWQRMGLPVQGPIPADAAFLPDVRHEFRILLGCYHDQVLAPFKALAGHRGINCTIGLPFLRTSPDHGTAFGIAGKGCADPESMLLAWDFLLNNTAPEVLT